MRITLLTGKTYDIRKNFDFDFEVNRTKLAKRLTIRIDHKKKLPIVTIPHSCSQSRAIKFIESNQLWIKHHMNQIPDSKLFEDGDIISLFGQKYTIVHDDKLKLGTFIKDANLYVSGQASFTHRRVKDFIKTYAKIELAKMAHEAALKLDKKINTIFIKDTKSRWGSCSSNNNINFNWRISLAPDYAIKYLVYHEVAHLKEQNHSEDFWKTLEFIYPEYEKGQLWLKNHGKELYLYE